MDLRFANGNKVMVDGLSVDTGVSDKGRPARELVPIGTIQESSLWPPGTSDATKADPSANPSPHYVVRLSDRFGEDHDIWVSEPRLMLVP